MKARISLYAEDGMAWMNKNQLVELFDISKQNICKHIANIFRGKELAKNSIIKKNFKK